CHTPGRCDLTSVPTPSPAIAAIRPSSRHLHVAMPGNVPPPRRLPRGGRTSPGTPMRSGGQKARIAVIPGDGIGAEVTPQAVKVFQAVSRSADRELEFVEFDWGAEKYLREGVTLPSGALELLRDEFDAILFGALDDTRVPSNQPAADILLGLRFV